MSIVSQNIRHLRKQVNLTQEQFAEKIGIKRSNLGAYEEGRADPRLSRLTDIAEAFSISVDALISEDLTPFTSEELRNRPRAEKLKVLSITVDQEDRENIELIPQKASAGYLNGYADPEFITELPKFKLPMFPTGTHRAFEIAGDSMLPLKPGTIVVGQYVEKLDYIKNGKTYVLVTSSEGIVYKRVFNYLDDKNALFLVSDNKTYEAYQLKREDIMEVWEAKAYISVDFPDTADDDMTIEKLSGIVKDLQQEVVKLRKP